MPNLLMPVKAISYVFLLFLFMAKLNYAQEMDVKNDLLLIEKVAKKQIPNSVNRPYIFKNQPKTFKNSNPVSLAFGGSLYFYQNFISQHLSASCLYHPSCSDFSKQCVKQYGLFKGTLLSFDRLSRCNRIAATDLNPVKLDSDKKRFYDPVNLYK